MQALLDLIFAVDGSVSDAAKYLGLSTGAVSRLILSDDSLRKEVNDLRASKDFVSSEVDGRDAVLAPYHSIKLEIDTRNSIYQPWIFSASNSIHTLSDWMVLCYKV
ncbi:hypothetical protein KIW84_013214 [Lathyrus oleraceus]|uniref:Uncharacterized protein n=1 Tax=Pisum sativum TaxID=3888 RepID=A0A9D5BJU0_PEA|nr:hypothetical protein KIW84_013214 [Pisum sativum]